MIISKIPCQNNRNINDFVYEEYIVETELYISIIKYNGKSQNVIIPEKINDGLVAAIGSEAFLNCKNIVSIRLPNTIEYIGDDAFTNCENLKIINIPEGVIEIGTDAFWGCSSLEKISLPATLEDIGDGPFEYCINLNEILVNKNNRYYNSINGILFDKEGKTLVRFPAGKKGTYYIPNGIKTIGADAFSDCLELEDIIIPNSVETIEYGAFNWCINLTVINIPNNVKKIAPGVFDNCDNLQSINVDTYNKNYKSINGILFDYSVKDLIKVPSKAISGEYSIPNTVEVLRPGAFLGCRYLETLNLPDSLTHLAYTRESNSFTFLSSLFGGCDNLINFNISDSNKNFRCVNGVLFDKNAKELVAYPIGRKGSYAVPDGVALLGYSCFSGCLGLTSIEMPLSVGEIQLAAFMGCKNIEYIYINNPNIVFGWVNIFRDCINIDKNNKNGLIEKFGESIF
jgi:hypothetical protein